MPVPEVFSSMEDPMHDFPEFPPRFPNQQRFPPNTKPMPVPGVFGMAPSMGKSDSMIKPEAQATFPPPPPLSSSNDSKKCKCGKCGSSSQEIISQSEDFENSFANSFDEPPSETNMKQVVRDDPIETMSGGNEHQEHDNEGPKDFPKKESSNSEVSTSGLDDLPAAPSNDDVKDFAPQKDSQ
jgi:hypothetical protein